METFERGSFTYKVGSILKFLFNLFCLVCVSIFIVILLVREMTPQPIDLSDDLNSKCKTQEECVEQLKQKKLDGINFTSSITVQRIPGDPERIRTFFDLPLSLMLFDVFLENRGSSVRVESGKPMLFQGDPYYASLGCQFGASTITVANNSMNPTGSKVSYDATGLVGLIKNYNGCSILLSAAEFSTFGIPQGAEDIQFKWERKIFINFKPDSLSYGILFVFVFPLLIALIDLSKKTVLICRRGVNYFKSE